MLAENVKNCDDIALNCTLPASYFNDRLSMSGLLEPYFIYDAEIML